MPIKRQCTTLTFGQIGAMSRKHPIVSSTADCLILDQRTMPVSLTLIKRGARSVSRKFREARMIAKALNSPRHPILVHLIPVRRCNLSYAYCNEYDDFSMPVPTRELLDRIDRLAALGTSSLHLSGGEPLLHPEVDTII